MKVNITDELTLRKNYVEQCYDDTTQKNRDYVENKNNWVDIDETTDVEGWYVVNVINETLELENAGKTFFLHTDVLKKTNNSTTPKYYQSMCKLWPFGIEHNVLFFLSDTVPSIVGKSRKSYTKPITKNGTGYFMAHAIHRVT